MILVVFFLVDKFFYCDDVMTIIHSSSRSPFGREKKEGKKEGRRKRRRECNKKRGNKEEGGKTKEGSKEKRKKMVPESETDGQTHVLPEGKKVQLCHPKWANNDEVTE